MAWIYVRPRRRTYLLWNYSWPHLRSTSSQYSLFIRRYSCSATYIILPKSNWSLISLCFTLPLQSASFISSSTSFWYQFLHFRLNYSFTHHFSLFWFTILHIHNPISLFHSRLKTYLLYKSYQGWIKDLEKRAHYFPSLIPILPFLPSPFLCPYPPLLPFPSFPFPPHTFPSFRLPFAARRFGGAL